MKAQNSVINNITRAVFKINFKHEFQIIEISTFSFCQCHEISITVIKNSMSKSMFKLDFHDNASEKIFLEFLQHILFKKNVILVNLIVIKKSYKQLCHSVYDISIRCV